MILAIDPGNEQSGVVLIREADLKPIVSEKITNEELLDNLLMDRYERLEESECINHVAIEMIASYGMAVGQSVFETCVWIGRFIQALEDNYYNDSLKFIYRKDEKMNLCGSMKAKDSNIVQALIDRFAPNTPNKGKGTKKEPGWFYGFKKDIWQAYAVAITYYDMYIEGNKYE
ncbi:hypothetical protein [Clostridium disporicum]|uniref:hypothetical protein n=1 Tax=Clostridium disporicum TaxID=84024 RepID=UPI0006C557DB|nr:hypothetical protein [Clostridium disporicum]CUN38103.1 Uncharacterised protein [Clostridium disporicum]